LQFTKWHEKQLANNNTIIFRLEHLWFIREFPTCLHKMLTQNTLRVQTFARLKNRKIFDINFRELDKKVA